MLIEDDAGNERVHTRQITCHGYRREDGLWQIEASVADRKEQTVPFKSRPSVLPGELIHHLSLTVVIDDDGLILDAAAAVIAAPWPACSEIAAAYRKLIGLRIGPGFNREVRSLFGGTNGCSHLTDLLGQIGNTYMQTTWPDHVDEQGIQDDAHRQRSGKRVIALVDGCYAWRKNGAALASEYPHLADLGESEV